MPPSLPPTPSGFIYRFRTYVLSNIFRQRPDNPVDMLGKALGECSNSVDARGSMGTKLITLSCESTHPAVAAGYLNALVKEFSREALDTRRKSLEERTRWMAEQMGYLKDQLENSEQKLQSFIRTSGDVEAGDEQKFLRQARLQQMEQAAAALQAERTSKQSLYEAAQSMPAESFTLTPEGASLRPAFLRVQQARKEVAALSLNRTPQNPKLKAAQEQADMLEDEFQAQRELILTRLRRDYEDVGRREQLHQAAYDRQLRGPSQTPAEKLIELNILKRQVELDRQLYQSFMANLQQANMILALPGNTARLIDPAESNLQPIQARTWAMSTMLGMFALVLMALIWILLQEKANQRVFSPDDVSSLLRLPELGVIPAIDVEEPRGRKWLPGFRSKHVKEGVVNKPVLTLTARGESTAEVEAWRPKSSLFTESFRGTLASLEGLTRHGIQPQVLVVTSPGPKEGKSTVAMNLAIALAEAHSSVLLVDADMRSPQLHRLLGITNDRGLAEILQGAVTFDEWQPLQKATSIPRLWLLPSGERQPDPGPLFHSQKLPRLLACLREQFKYIVIDTPPVVDLTDARLVGRLSDGVILVLRSGNTDRSRALAARRRIMDDGTLVLGTILNEWQDPAAGGSYYYYGKPERGRRSPV
jgi:capsular exopolysaccharide synthesis family protein